MDGTAPLRSSSSQDARARIKQTVERAAPQIEMDVTKVLTDEEVAAIHAQYAQRKAAEILASESDRQTLRARLKRAVQSSEQQSFAPTSVFDPEALKKKLADPEKLD